jgi:FdhD protein
MMCDDAIEEPAHDAAPAAPMADAASRVIALDGTMVRDETRIVAVEAAIQVAFADIPFAVMMLTPADLVDFAYGFSLTEGMIDKADDIREVTIGPVEGGTRLRITLVGAKLQKHLARQRAMTGRTGCGVCGIDDLQALRRATRVDAATRPVTIAAVARALADLDQRQTLNAATRAVHGAAWADRSGAIREVREDVGRHNALDKLIGALLRARVDPADGFVLITSRCSFEMVEKAATFGARLLVAISAPTSLAIARAEALDLTLVAIARRDTLTVFTHRDRLVV